VIGVGLAYSVLFYPTGARDLLQTSVVIERACDCIAATDEAPIHVRMRGKTGMEADARMLWAVRFLMGIAEGAAQ
jgi:hypothetical protein